MPGRSNNIDAYLAQRIRAARIAAGVTQNALGAALGVTFQQVQKYERGTNRVSAGRLYHIADILDVPIGHFFERAPKPTKPK